MGVATVGQAEGIHEQVGYALAYLFGSIIVLGITIALVGIFWWETLKSRYWDDYHLRWDDFDWREADE